MSGKVERIGWAVRLAFDDDDVRWTWPNTGGMWTEKRAVREADAWAEDGYDAKAMPLYAEGTIESLEAERDELRATVERAKAIIGEYVGSPCFSALLGEYDEDQGCGCPTCGHRAAFRALNPKEEG